MSDNPAAMTERLIDAAIYAETASGVYVAPARREVNDSRYSIEAEITRLREALSSETAAREKAEREVERIKAVALAHVDETTELQRTHHIALADAEAVARIANATLEETEKRLSSETAAREKAERERLQLARSLNATARARNEADDRLADLTRKLEVAAGALREMIYETTHLSPLRDDGAHDCRISGQTLRRAREARAAILGEEKS